MSAMLSLLILTNLNVTVLTIHVQAGEFCLTSKNSECCPHTLLYGTGQTLLAGELLYLDIIGPFIDQGATVF